MLTIELLVGMIASGKSTYARSRADVGALVISHDALTAMLHTRYRYEQGLRDVYRRMEEALALAALETARNVVIDRTHLTRESRARWIQFAHALEVPTEIVAVCFPIEPHHIHAHRRFESDPRGRTLEEWMRVAAHHWSQAYLEGFDPDEGFDRIVKARWGGPLLPVRGMLPEHSA